jgi:phosphoglycolate phosphatase-like HAD superfamily hydrolase
MDTGLTLVVAALLFGVALVALRAGRAVSDRLGELGQQLRQVDTRLVEETPVLAAKLGAQRTDLAAVSTATERALWSLARFDERVDAARAGLASRQEALERDKARLIAARSMIIRAKKSARMVLKMLELRRAFLG